MKIGWDLTKIQSILSRWLKSIQKIAINQTKKDNVPPRRQQLYNGEAIWSPRDRMINALTIAEKGEWSTNVLTNSENANQPNEKGRCAPQKTATLQSRSCLIFQGSFDQFYQWLNKEDDNRHICQSPPLNNEPLHLTIDDGVNLLFCIFLVLKNT